MTIYPTFAFNQNVERLANGCAVEIVPTIVQRLLQCSKAGTFHIFRHLRCHFGCRRAGAWAVFERVGAGKTNLVHQPHRVLEIGISLAGEADNEVG